jgi:hypothetical protein
VEWQNNVMKLFTILHIQGAPKVKYQTVGNSYLGQNKEKIKNTIFFQKRSVYQISAILSFLQHNFYLRNFSTSFYETRYVCLN